MIVPPEIRMSPQSADVVAPIPLPPLPPAAAMVPFEIVIFPQVPVLSLLEPIPAESEPLASTVPVVSMTMFPQDESYAAPMPAAYWLLPCNAVTLALPEIVMSPHGLLSLAAPMHAAYWPPVAVTTALPVIVMSPQAASYEQEPMPAPQ